MKKKGKQLRALIGSLQYASVNTRPDIASRLSFLQSKVNSATIETLLEANKALHETKRHHDVEIVIQPIFSCRDLRFLAFSDASFASKGITRFSHWMFGNEYSQRYHGKCPVPS